MPAKIEKKTEETEVNIQAENHNPLTQQEGDSDIEEPSAQE